MIETKSNPAKNREKIVKEKDVAYAEGILWFFEHKVSVPLRLSGHMQVCRLFILITSI
jgi:hypothetical protein